jgi:hypothetical protein
VDKLSENMKMKLGRTRTGFVLFSKNCMPKGKYAEYVNAAI